MAFDLPIPPELDDPLLGFRFGVFFLGTVGVAHPLDFRFQSVSGISVELETESIGGKSNNVNGFSAPKGLKYSNLILKRGFPLISTLSMEIQASFSSFQFSPRNVLLSVVDENGIPLNSWIFSEAYPVKWSLNDLDASSSQVLIESVELTYRSFKPFLL